MSAKVTFSARCWLNLGHPVNSQWENLWPGKMSFYWLITLSRSKSLFFKPNRPNQAHKILAAMHHNAQYPILLSRCDATPVLVNFSVQLFELRSIFFKECISFILVILLNSFRSIRYLCFRVTYVLWWPVRTLPIMLETRVHVRVWWNSRSQ